ncbi:MAG: Rieske 2Fe-2S domain-containing protein [Rhodospirillales bacterium]|nr:Rieske 2Fe-2S domain-containing protein [Rhodospirillales bacterium]
MRHALCRFQDIPDRGSEGFVVAGAAEAIPVMALRRGERVYVYVNSCPHWGSPLDLVPGRFLDRRGEYALCSTHGARFRVEDGVCVSGPCRGAALIPLQAIVEDGSVMIVD